MSLEQIKVARTDVLKIVRENKEKHDGILKLAIEGYWIDAEAFLKKYEKETIDNAVKSHKAQLKKLRKDHKAYVKNVKALVKEDLEKVKTKNPWNSFHYWRGAYPEDHGDDYLGTIRRLELCIEPEIDLNDNEFNSYIRNKWTWKESFITSNRAYVTSCASSLYGTGSLLYDGGKAGRVGNVQPSYAMSASYANNSINYLSSF